MSKLPQYLTSCLPLVEEMNIIMTDLQLVQVLLALHNNKSMLNVQRKDNKFKKSILYFEM